MGGAWPATMHMGTRSRARVYWILLAAHLVQASWTLNVVIAGHNSTSDPAPAPLFCPCVNRGLFSFSLLMHYRDAITTVGAQLRAGVRQAARDRGVRVNEYIPVDFFRVSEVISFLENEIQGGTAGIITTLSTDQLLPTLAAANEADIPIYFVGAPEPELYQGFQKREPATGPINASIRRIGPDMAQVAATLASRLMSQGITHLECITTEAGELSWHAQCDRLVAAFEAAGRIGLQHLRAGLSFDLADYALDMATRLADVPDREVAVVVADTTLYKTLRSSLALTAKAGTSVVVYETSLEVLADVRAGANAVALDFEYYAQGYLGLSLAATERHTGQVVTSDIVTGMTIYGAGANGSQVTDAIMQREVCRAARYPVCGDPGVVPVTATGCPCFNRSEVAYKVIGLIPSRVVLSHALWQGMADAQRDLPGSTYRWDVLDEVDFSATIADYLGVAASDIWRGAISLDPMFPDVPPIVGAMRAVPAAGKRLYLSTGHMAGRQPSDVDALLAFFGAGSFVGPNAITSGAACTRVEVQAGLRHLVISNVLPFFSWTWAFVRGMMEGFLGGEFPFPPGLWEGDVAGKSDEGNRTGVYELFVAPETNRTVQAINGISTVDYLGGLERQVRTGVPAADAVALIVYDEFMSPTILAMLDELARSQPGRPPVQLVTQRCLHSEMLALLRRGQVQGEQLLLGCMDEQPYLSTYLPALLAALEQHTGERVVGEVSTARFLQASQLPPNFARRAACELAGVREGYEKGQWGTYYPLCDARQGCVQGGGPNATVCSGHGTCVFPTHPAGNEMTRGAAGACECERGYTGEYCEKRESDKAGWLDTHPLGSALVIVMAVIVGVVLPLGIGLPVYFLWFRKGKGHGSEEFLQKRNPPQKGDVITVVITDIEGSTELWEWNPDVMKRALAIHHTVLRAFLPKYYGYESDTAGDSFSLIFHDAADALGWAMEVQRALLFPMLALAPEELLASPGGRPTSLSHRSSASQQLIPLQSDWPQELLSFSLGREEPCSGQEPPIYRGLRVRMGMHIGVAEECASHANGRQHYHGEVMDVTKAVADVGVSGGQVLMSMPAWQSLGQPPLSVSCQHLGLHEVCKKLDPIHLMQVVPDDLAKRVPFRPLKSKQLSPSFFDAPCSDCYVKGVAPTHPIVIAFIYVGHSKSLRGSPGYQPAVNLLVGLVQELLLQYEGYECEEKDGNFLLAFASPVMAARMAEALQCKAMGLPWPERLLELEQASEVTKPAGEGAEEDVGNDVVVFRGLRLQIGLCMGVPAECNPHRATGRAAYYGPIVNRAARIAATAAAGQTLCNDMLHDSIKASTPDLTFKELGKFDLKGVREPMRLFQVSSPALSARLFPRVLKLAQQLAMFNMTAGHPGSEEGSLCSVQSPPHSHQLPSVAMEPVEGVPVLGLGDNSPSVSNNHKPGPGGSRHGRKSFSLARMEEQVRAEYAESSHEDLLRLVARLKSEMQVMQVKILRRDGSRKGQEHVM
eukprot:jgi/Mesvir1/21837/Mv04220-RA.1